MEKKGLYISLDHVFDMDSLEMDKTSNGIIKKIANQFYCFKDYGFDMDIFFPYKNRSRYLHAIVRRLPLSGFISYGKNYIRNAKDYSFIYLRKPWFMNSDTPRFLKKMKKKNSKIKIVVEYPTFDSSSSKGEVNHLNMWPLYIKDKVALKKICKLIDRVLTFSKDKEILGVETIQTCNAINPTQTKKINYVKTDEKEIHLIACSSMAFWHGFDRIIEGLGNYYERENVPYKIVFHLIGDGEELDNYRGMVRNRHLEEVVLVYGYKFGKELDDIYDICDIAVDSLGRHRSGVFYNSSLKGKEYLAKGLPVMSGVTNELDFDSSFKYYLRVPANDSPVDMHEVVSFYEKIYKGSETREEVIDNISTYASKNFSYKASFKDLVSFLNGSDNV